MRDWITQRSSFKKVFKIAAVKLVAGEGFSIKNQSRARSSR